jgi:hypothetical protein
MKTRGYVTVAETKQALRALYRGDHEINLRIALLRAFEDRQRPIAAKGRWQPSQILILLAVVACATVGVFAYFSLGVRR